MVISFLLLFFLSRILFINSQPVFFDSPQYLTRLSDSSFLNAVTSGHLPLHLGYIILFWPIYQTGQFLGLNPGLLVIVGQIILATVAIFFFYLFIKIISDKTTAFYASLISSTLPLFWIVNVTIMMETTYFAFFAASVYFLAKYSIDKKPKEYHIVISNLCLGISFLTHLGVILWVPMLIYLSFFLNRKIFVKITMLIFLTILLASLLNSFFIASVNHLSILQGLLALYSAKIGEHARLETSFYMIIVYLRNFLIPLFRNFTILVVVLAFVSVFPLFFKKRSLFFLVFLWISPSFIANQWWDSLLFGRHSLIAGFGLVFLTACFIRNNKIVVLIMMLYLFITAIPAIYLLKKEIPYLHLAKHIEKLPINGLLIETHFARPQIAGKYKGEIIFVDEPGFEKEKLSNKMQNLLKDKKQVFVSSQALSEPYGLYSGPYLHALSLSYKNDFVLKPIIQQFTLEEYKIISKEDNLLIYQVVSDKPSIYPKIKNLKDHRRRMDYSDPLLFIYNKLKGLNFF